MRTIREFTIDIVKTPPIAFPLIGLFHILWFLWIIYSDRYEPFPDLVWFEVLWMTGYTIFWFAACDMRKWGARGYIIMTLINAVCFILARFHIISTDYVSNMFVLDVLFSMILVYYYKKFR